MNKRLESLLRKREELNAQIQKIKSKEAVQKRKEDNTARKRDKNVMVRLK